MRFSPAQTKALNAIATRLADPYDNRTFYLDDPNPQQTFKEGYNRAGDVTAARAQKIP